MEIVFTLDSIDEIAQKILDTTSRKTFVLQGEMGAGKTTFIKAIARELGVSQMTHSPTFSIVNEYETPTGQKIYHFDLYRLRSLEEAYDIGIEDYLYAYAYCFIEWPEKITSLLPDDFVTISISTVDNDTRKLTLEL